MTLRHLLFGHRLGFLVAALPMVLASVVGSAYLGGLMTGLCIWWVAEQGEWI